MAQRVATTEPAIRNFQFAADRGTASALANDTAVVALAHPFGTAASLTFDLRRLSRVSPATELTADSRQRRTPACVWYRPWLSCAKSWRKPLSDSGIG
jgi:hypothetical protein